MHHGDMVVILKDKIMVSEKELAPIGIMDQSRCWGRWVPDRRETDQNKYFSHLVVSPFEISSWPVLFRITVVVENQSRKIGSLAEILKILKSLDLNILAAEGTPAGHRHATINIIAEATKFTEDADFSKLLKDMKEVHDDKRYMVNDKERGKYKHKPLEEMLHTKFVPHMLNFTWVIKRALYDGNNAANERFLRETFIQENGDRRSQEAADQETAGLIYDPRRLEKYKEMFVGENLERDEIIIAGQRQFLKAVNCTWLQNHAYYWLFGVNKPDPRILRFDSHHSALRPEEAWKEEYTEMVSQGDGEVNLPFKSLSTINYTEHYLRILFAKEDKQQRTRRVKIPFKAAFPGGGNTKGLLSTFCDAFEEQKISLRRVLISTIARDEEHESGIFNFLVTENSEPDASLNEADAVDFLERRIKLAIKKGKETAAKDVENLNIMEQEKENLKKKKEEEKEAQKKKEEEEKAGVETVANGDTQEPIGDNELQAPNNDSVGATKFLSQHEVGGKKKIGNSAIMSRKRRLTIENEQIVPFQTKMLFLSTRFEWLEQERPNLLGKLQKKAEEYGFDLYVAHNNYRCDKDQPDRYKVKKHLEHLFVPDEKPLTTNILRGIKNANVFLQIIPKQATTCPKQENGLEWLLFEYGIALALGLPCAICVDISGTSIGEWQEKLKGQAGKDFIPFSSGKSDSMIIADIESAFEVLNKRIQSARDNNHLHSNIV